LRRDASVVALLVIVIASCLLAAACGGGDEEQPTSTVTPAATTGDGGELTEEQAIERALEVIRANPDNHPDPSTATATRMTEREAVETMQRAGVSGQPPTPAAESPVWLVEIRGEFVGFIPGPARPGRYFLILGLDGFPHSGAFVPDASPAP
jgi:ABC-type glycerol-3-phosphate transport system substrate-binding protein